MEENKVIDIKAKWREIKEWHKLSQAREFYAIKETAFEVVDCDTIAVDFIKLRYLIDADAVRLHPALQKRLDRKK